MSAFSFGCSCGQWAPDVIVLHQHLGRRAAADAPDDLLVLLVGPEDVEDDQVRVERVEIVLGRADQQLGGEAADGPVLDLQVGVGEARLRRSAATCLLHSCSVIDWP